VRFYRRCSIGNFAERLYFGLTRCGPKGARRTDMTDRTTRESNDPSEDTQSVAPASNDGR